MVALKKKPRTPAQISVEGFSALVKKLGLPDALRFLQQNYQGKGDYTKERHQWLDKLSREDVRRLMSEKPRRAKNRK